MKKTILSLLIFAASAASAGPEKQIDSEGRLVVFRIVPGDKSAQVFLMGRKAGELTVDPKARLLSVRAISPSGAEELHFREDGGSYLVTPLPKSNDLTLSLSAEIDGQKENAKIRVRKP